MSLEAVVEAKVEVEDVSSCVIGAGTSYPKSKPTTNWLITLIKVKPGMTGGKVSLVILHLPLLETSVAMPNRIRKTVEGNY